MPVVHDIAVMLRETRYALGMSQSALGLILGVDRSTIAGWESDIHAPCMGLRQYVARDLRHLMATKPAKANARLRCGRKPGPKNIWSKLPAPKKGV